MLEAHADPTVTFYPTILNLWVDHQDAAAILVDILDALALAHSARLGVGNFERISPGDAAERDPVLERAIEIVHPPVD